jgi:hypothetical protein
VHINNEEAATVALQVPTLQAVHDEDPATDHNPALQLRHAELKEALMAVDQSPALQLKQDEMEVAEMDDDHVPIAQLLHTVED